MVPVIKRMVPVFGGVIARKFCGTGAPGSVPNTGLHSDIGVALSRPRTNLACFSVFAIGHTVLFAAFFEVFLSVLAMPLINAFAVFLAIFSGKTQDALSIQAVACAGLFQYFLLVRLIVAAFALTHLFSIFSAVSRGLSAMTKLALAGFSIAASGVIVKFAKGLNLAAFCAAFLLHGVLSYWSHLAYCGQAVGRAVRAGHDAALAHGRNCTVYG